MTRISNIFALLFVFASFLFTVNAQLPGGWAPVDSQKDLNDLKKDLQNSNIACVVGGGKCGVEVKQIVSASQQVVAGMNYRIEATVLINGFLHWYCIKAERDLPPNDKLKVVSASEKSGNSCKWK